MLTRSGLGALVGAIVVAVLGAWWRYEEFVVAGAGIAMLVLLAVWVARQPSRVVVERRVNALRVPRGSAIRVVYRVVNDTRHRSAGATVVDRCDDQQITVAVEPVEPKGTRRLWAAIPTTRRGVFPLGPLEVERTDPFLLAVGRWRNDQDVVAPIPVTVHPRVYDMVGPRGAMRAVENESAIRRAATDPLSGFVSLRTYVPGDDTRMILWPTTARTGTLMVREHVEIRRPDFTIVVDTDESIGSEDDFEEAVDVAATLGVHAIRQGLGVVVRTTDPGHGGSPSALRDERQVLDVLTSVERSPSVGTVPLPVLFMHGLDQASIVMVTGATGPSSRVPAIDRLAVVRIGRDARAGPGIALAAADAADFVNRWQAWS